MHESMEEIGIIATLASLSVGVVFCRAVDGAVLEGAGLGTGG
jgi:hypothetical protein